MTRHCPNTPRLSRRVAAPVRARIDTLRDDPERGNLMMSLAVVIIFATIALGLFSATVAASTLGRASALRAANLDTANSLRSQILGTLNAAATTVTSDPTSGAIIVALPSSVTGCTGSPTVQPYSLGPQGCATIGYTITTPDTPTVMATHDQTVSVTVNAWQHPGTGTTTALATVRQTFQAYGTCVTGYLPGTGNNSGVPTVYTPCKATTPAAAQHLIWYAKDSAG
jgi:hypothetical protein